MWLKIENCKIIIPEQELLGQVVNEIGVTRKPAKVAAIQKEPCHQLLLNASFSRGFLIANDFLLRILVKA